MVEAISVGVGDAEQLADDQARYRQGQVLDEVDGLGAAGDRVEVFGDDPVEVGLEVGLDALGRESAGEQATVLVVLWLVHHDEPAVEQSSRSTPNRAMPRAAVPTCAPRSVAWWRMPARSPRHRSSHGPSNC
ncbi:MAG TPA: hypothetical protein VGJ45_23640 [Pseudonocardiaceae bacterium]